MLVKIDVDTAETKPSEVWFPRHACASERRSRSPAGDVLHRAREEGHRLDVEVGRLVRIEDLVNRSVSKNVCNTLTSGKSVGFEPRISRNSGKIFRQEYEVSRITQSTPDQEGAHQRATASEISPK